MLNSFQLTLFHKYAELLEAAFQRRLQEVGDVLSVWLHSY